MDKVITIHEAKTHLSKYIKQAKAGQPVHIGSYGQDEVMLVVSKHNAPKKKKIQLGIWAGRKDFVYKDEDVVGPDPDIIADFEESLNRPLP